MVESVAAVVAAHSIEVPVFEESVFYSRFAPPALAWSRWVEVENRQVPAVDREHYFDVARLER